MAYVLWDRFLRHNPADPAWPNRDRFVLSAGHGSALLYALLHLTGYDLPLAELQRFRQWDSRTPGHPERGRTPGVEATTGPLGQGFAMAVGMAIAERHLAATFNRPGLALVDHHTYVLASDGDMMEGITSEAASLAGTLALGKLIVLYDDNHISLEGPTSFAFTEDVGHRFEAYGWNVRHVRHGNDLAEIGAALRTARGDASRPTLIGVRTHLGYDSPVQDTREAHGEPLGPSNLRATKQKLGWPLEPAFLIPPDALAHYREAVPRGAAWQREWDTVRDAYRAQYPEEIKRFDAQVFGLLPSGWDSGLPVFSASTAPLATRDASQQALQALAPKLPALIGGSADLAPSTKTVLPGTGDLSATDPSGRNLHFGVREHAMVAAVNGMALHGGLLPFGATFLNFSDYARGALRLSALQQAHVVFVFTHDTVALGEDGPTHQPIEQFAGLRAVPGFRVIRPADGNETIAAWRIAVASEGPTALLLTRQKLPVLDPARYAIATGVARGGYVLSESDPTPPQVILLATGSEVAVMLEAQGRLRAEGIGARVISLPCWSLFDEQPAEYRDSVLLRNVPRVSLEAASTFGWERYVGSGGRAIGIDRFGASAPGPVVLRELGISADHVLQTVRSLLPAPSTPGGP